MKARGNGMRTVWVNPSTGRVSKHPPRDWVPRSVLRRWTRDHEADAQAAAEARGFWKRRGDGRSFRVAFIYLVRKCPHCGLVRSWWGTWAFQTKRSGRGQRVFSKRIPPPTQEPRLYFRQTEPTKACQCPRDRRLGP